MKARLHQLAWLLPVCLLLAGQGAAWAEHKPLSKEEQEKVDQAIDRGVKLLKSQQIRKGPNSGAWLPFPLTERRYRLGYSVLPALALLESGVAADDPVIQRTAALLRRDASSLEWTYDLSLAILFLDRLNDPQDKELLKRLALRVLAGQSRAGGWSYRCPKLSRDNEETLFKLLQQGTEGTEPLEVPKPLRMLIIFQDPSTIWADLPPRPDGYPRAPLFMTPTDNSNTQFAMLALWAARRHDIPVAATLGLAVKRFRSSQKPNGTWGYFYRASSGASETRAMTTVGLLGLALGLGLAPAKPGETGKEIEAQILFGFAALSREIDAPTGQMRRPVPQPDLYFLWSVERVAALYHLDLIGDKDWYRWGVEILLTNQTRRGDWPQGTVDVLRPGTREVRDRFSTYGPTINTCFALLFLKRSNLTKDLTARLPYKPEELNKGIVQAIQNPQAIPQPERTPSQRSRKP